MKPIRSLLVMIIASTNAPAPIEAATVVFGDGLSHAIPGDPAFSSGDSIRLENGSRIVVHATALVEGVSGTSNASAIGEPALGTTPGTAARILEGLFVGGDATGGQDGSTPVAGLSAIAGVGVQHAGAGPGGAFGLDVPFGLWMTSGAIRGGSASVAVDATIDLADSRGGAALALSGVSPPAFGGTATIFAGDLQGGNATSSGSDLDNSARSGGIATLEPGSILVVHGGTHAAGFAHAANGLEVAGNASARGGNGLDLADFSTAVIHGGSFASGSAQADAGLAVGEASAAPGHAIRMDDGARIAVYGGSFSTGTSSTSSSGPPTPTAPAAAIRFEVLGSQNPTRLTLLGGTFRGDVSLDVPFTEATPGGGIIFGGAEIFIAGGDLDSPGDVDLRLAHPDVFTILLGTNFEVDGQPIVGAIPSTGTITGVLVNGQNFEWTYELLNGAELVVPEPAMGLLPAGLVALALAHRIRRSPGD